MVCIAKAARHRNPLRGNVIPYSTTPSLPRHRHRCLGLDVAIRISGLDRLDPLMLILELDIAIGIWVSGLDLC